MYKIEIEKQTVRIDIEILKFQVASSKKMMTCRMKFDSTICNASALVPVHPGSRSRSSHRELNAGHRNSG